MTYSIFISHSSKDRATVELIAKRVLLVGVAAYLYEHDPQPGTLLADKIKKAIRTSDAVVVLLTRKGASSPYVQQEIGVAVAANKLVIPLVEKGIPRKALALLDGVEYINFDPTAPDLAVSELSVFLGKRYAKEKQKDVRLLAVLTVAVLFLMSSE